jgi:hypothetical protein
MNHFLMTDNLKLADAEIQNHAMCISNWNFLIKLITVMMFNYHYL